MWLPRSKEESGVYTIEKDIEQGTRKLTNTNEWRQFSKTKIKLLIYSKKADEGQRANILRE